MKVRIPRALGALDRARHRELKLNPTSFASRAGGIQGWLSAIERGKPTAEIGRVLRTLAVLSLILDAHVESSAQRDSSPPARRSLPKIDIDEIVDRHR